MSRIIKLKSSRLFASIPPTVTQRTLLGSSTPTGSLVAIPAGGVPNTAPSPTGREPFVYTPERQARWNRLQSENHWLWQYALNNANQTGTANQRYCESGTYAAFVYQVTGDTSYALKSYNVLVSKMDKTLTASPNQIGANDVREYGTTYCINFDVIWPALDSTQKANAILLMERWANFTLAIGTGSIYRGGFRFDDTDPLFGYSGPLVFLQYFNVPENTGYGTWFSKANQGASTSASFGALTPPGTNSIRDRQDDVLDFALGGEWVESSEYNPGTFRFVCALWDIANRISPGAYPKIAQCIQDYAQKIAYEYTPDFLEHVNWGDEQLPRAFLMQYRAFAIWTTWAMVAGLVKELGNTTLAGQVTTSVNALRAAYASISPVDNDSLIDRCLWTYDPYITPVATPSLPSKYRADGMKMDWVKTTNTLFWHYSNRVLQKPPIVYNGVGVDHNVEYGSNFQLYRNGNWVLRNPIGYDVFCWRSDAVNGLSIANLRSWGYSRDEIRRESGSDWLAITTGTTPGAAYNAPGYYDPPPAYINSLERRVVHIEDVNGCSVVVVRSVVDAVDPATLTKFDRYRTEQQADINNKWAVKVEYVHTPVLPSVSSNEVSWTTGADLTKCTILSPAAFEVEVRDESVVYAGVTGMLASEKKWHFRIRQNPESQVTQFLYVIISGSGPHPIVSSSDINNVTIGSRTVTFAANSTTVT